MSIQIRTKQAFKDAKIKQFMSAITDPQAQAKGEVNFLRALGFNVQQDGGTTFISKGRAIISLDGMNKAEVTLIVG